MVAGARSTVETPSIARTTADATNRPRLSSHDFRSSILVPPVISVVAPLGAPNAYRGEHRCRRKTGDHSRPGYVRREGNVGGAGHQPRDGERDREPVEW